MISAAQAQQLLRKRMVEISHTATEAGILNYGSLVVQPAPIAAVQPDRAVLVPRERALIASR